MPRIVNKQNFPAAKMKPKTVLSEQISDAMRERGVEIKDIAEHLGITYEHARRFVRGESVPSRLALKALAELLGLNFKEIEKQATADRIAKKYGSIPLELAGKNPEIYPIERAWKFLNDEQKNAVISLAQTLAKQNRS